MTIQSDNVEDLTGILEDSYHWEVGYDQVDFLSPAWAVIHSYQTTIDVAVFAEVIRKGYYETLDLGGPSFDYIAEEVYKVLEAFDPGAVLHHETTEGR